MLSPGLRDDRRTPSQHDWGSWHPTLWNRLRRCLHSKWVARCTVNNSVPNKARIEKAARITITSEELSILTYEKRELHDTEVYYWFSSAIYSISNRLENLFRTPDYYYISCRSPYLSRVIKMQTHTWCLAEVPSPLKSTLNKTFDTHWSTMKIISAANWAQNHCFLEKFSISKVTRWTSCWLVIVSVTNGIFGS